MHLQRISDTYDSTFNVRGHVYDDAMHQVPDARKHEFETLIRLADLKDGDTVCDFPSGGGYLGRYVDRRVQLNLLETSQVFYDLCLKNGSKYVTFTTENCIPFGNGYFDKILSLAGIHHNPCQTDFFAECARALKAGGSLCIGDVHEGSRIARFLNEFVHEHNDGGHDGSFLGAHTLKEIANAGLCVQYSEVVSYPWMFASREEMVEFCTQLFGLGDTPPSTVLEGLKTCVGINTINNQVLMNWELYFIKASKPAASD